MSAEPPPARNGPCPCGSGRKFKRCCGRTPAHDAVPAGWTDTDRHVAVSALERLASSARFRQDVERGAALWDEEDVQAPDDESEMAELLDTLFIEWVWFDCVLSTRQTLTQEVLAAATWSLTAGATRLLVAATNAPLRCLEVAEADVDRLWLTDRIDPGLPFAVTPLHASELPPRGALLLARIATRADDTRVLLGASCWLQPAEAGAIAAAVRQMRGTLATEVLAGGPAIFRMFESLTMVRILSLIQRQDRSDVETEPLIVLPGAADGIRSR